MISRILIVSLSILLQICESSCLSNIFILQRREVVSFAAIWINCTQSLEAYGEFIALCQLHMTGLG